MEQNQESPPQCYRCDWSHEEDLIELYGYTICSSCESELGLFKDGTIKKHYLSFDKKKNLDPTSPSYAQELQNRLISIEQHYISSRIKLLHIQERLNQMMDQ
ncbi:MAG: hypothetical protein AB8H47_24060 [Bacteroidia bacterium]